MRYLLDTNALSEPIRPIPSPHFLDALTRNRQLVATAAPVWNELLYGVRRLPESRRKQRLSSYLHDVIATTMTILPYDARAADWHARERARLTAIGATPAFVDGQIAAIARVHGLVVVTRNTLDFVHFEDIGVEDWTQLVEPIP